jgi:uncharacterized protein (DUF2062 family)
MSKFFKESAMLFIIYNALTMSWIFASFYLKKKMLIELKLKELFTNKIDNYFNLMKIRSIFFSLYIGF